MADIQDDPVSIDLDTQRQKLLEMREQLERDIANKVAQVAESGDDLVPERGGISNHMADDANEVFEQETMLTLQQTAERQLALVNTSLTRIDEGTYGTCANCGKQITPARLEARPWAILCIDCQQLEDEGRL
jgi:RNA polymerase-binding transcription factor